jgi:hypothetical protein
MQNRFASTMTSARTFSIDKSKQRWGAKVIDRLSADLRAAFPEMRGLSSSNLKYMRFFASECPNRRFGQQSADQLPWFHIVTLITKLRAPELREWYAREALAHSWPEHAGQLNFYLSAVDAQIKMPDDAPTIGLLLCRTHNRLVAEYALSGFDKPIGVAEYQLLRSLPEPLDVSLPSIAQIEAELARDLVPTAAERAPGSGASAKAVPGSRRARERKFS